MIDPRGYVGVWSAVSDQQLDVRIGVPVRRRRVMRSQAIRPSQGDGWTCPRCRVVNLTNASACRCGALRAR